MDIEEAIQHCKDVAENCNNQDCALNHLQLMSWLIELKDYHEKYGNIENLYPSITLTKSNLNKEKIFVKDITKIEIKEGVYEGNNHYHSCIWVGNNFYYYMESVEEINKLIKMAMTHSAK